MDSGRPQITDTQKAALFQVLLLFLLVTGVLGVISRTLIKYFAIRRIGVDDWLIFVSAAFYIAQSATLFVATQNGFGDQEPEPAQDQTEMQMKSLYIVTILQLLSIAFAKFSYLVFIRALSRVQLEKRICDILTGTIGIWALSGVLSGALKCKLPHPWDFTHQDQCINLEAWWLYVTILNVLTELFLIVLPARIILRLQVNRLRKKIPALTVFSLRVLVIVPAILQCYYYAQAVQASNVAFSRWESVLCAQFVQCMAIVVPCFLYIRLLIESLESGFLRVDDQRRREGGSYGSSGKVLSNQSSQSRPDRRSVQPRSGISSEGVRTNTYP